jgi:ribonuclease HI
MINLLEEKRERTLEKTPRPPNEILELEKKQATELAEVKFSQYFQQMFAEPLDKTRCEINKVKEQVSLQDSTKTENTVGHDNVNHQVLEEGIDNMFIVVDSPFIDEERKEGSWGLDFDGAHSSVGSGAGIVLRSPDNETTLFSYRLEFDCTNNIAKYEALILGINLAIDMNIKNLHVKWDSDLIVSQVNRKFAAKNPRLKQYRDVVWEAIKRFENFSIEAIPREENHLADSLVVSTSNLQLSKEIGFYKVEVNFRPSLPDNLEHWCYPRFLGITRRSCLEAHRS